MSSAAADFVYTPSDFLGWALKSGWQPSTLPIGVVYTFQGTITRAIAEDDRFVDNTDLQPSLTALDAAIGTLRAVSAT